MSEPTTSTRQLKITLGEMRASGVRSFLVYCADYRCARAVRICGDWWPDHIRLSDLEPLFVCQACGRRGADIRPDWYWDTRSSEQRAAQRADFGNGITHLRLNPGSVEWCATMNNPDQDMLIRALEDARRVLGEYIEPGPRDAARTVERLLAILDRSDLVHALDRIKGRRVVRLVE
jgi:hypothetical protein